MKVPKKSFLLVLAMLIAVSLILLAIGFPKKVQRSENNVVTSAAPLLIGSVLSESVSVSGTIKKSNGKPVKNFNLKFSNPDGTSL